jgi:hypothetical protein
VDRRRFKPGPELTFHFDADHDPDPDPDATQLPTYPPGSPFTHPSLSYIPCPILQIQRRLLKIKIVTTGPTILMLFPHCVGFFPAYLKESAETLLSFLLKEKP